MDTQTERAEMPREPTKGESLVRLKFNPPQNAEVDAIKAKTAELIDAVSAIAAKNGGSDAGRAAAIAVTNYQQACMWAVYAATA